MYIIFFRKPLRWSIDFFIVIFLANPEIEGLIGFTKFIKITDCNISLAPLQQINQFGQISGFHPVVIIDKG